MYPFDLALDGVIHRTGAGRTLMSRHVNTHQVHIFRKKLQKIKTCTVSQTIILPHDLIHTLRACVLEYQCQSIGFM